jgi:hypothetical protein
MVGFFLLSGRFRWVRKAGQRDLPFLFSNIFDLSVFFSTTLKQYMLSTKKPAMLAFTALQVYD